MIADARARREDTTEYNALLKRDGFPRVVRVYNRGRYSVLPFFRDNSRLIIPYGLTRV